MSSKGLEGCGQREDKPGLRVVTSLPCVRPWVGAWIVCRCERVGERRGVMKEC